MSNLSKQKNLRKRKTPPSRVDVFDDFMGEEDQVDEQSATPAEMPKNTMKEIPLPRHTAREGASSLDPASWFVKEHKKPRRVAMTFTLDPSIIELIDQASEKYKISRSRVIEKIAANTLAEH